MENEAESNYKWHRQTKKNERWMNSGEWTRGFMCPGNILLKLHTHERRASWPPGLKFANFKLEKTFRACKSWLWWTFVIKYVTIHYPEGSIPEPVNTNLYDLMICIQRSGRSSLHLTFLSTVASLNTGRGWGCRGGRMMFVGMSAPANYIVKIWLLKIPRVKWALDWA